MMQIIAGVILAGGLFLILADKFGIPYFKTSKSFESLAKKNNEKTSTLEIWLGGLANKIRYSKSFRSRLPDLNSVLRDMKRIYRLYPSILSVMPSISAAW